MAAAIQQVAIIGSGVIGSGWAARFLGAGLDVSAYDPAPGSEEKLRSAVDRAWPSIVHCGTAPDASPRRLRFSSTLEDCVYEAHFIQENAPEREALKQQLLAEIDGLAQPEAIIASSTSGLLPTRLQKFCAAPHRVLVGHPFNPVYLLPLVEVVAGELTSAKTISDTLTFYHSIGMRPLHVRVEIEGFIADRLMEALWREALWLVHDGVATTEEIDAAVVYGCGLRWSLMGTFLTFHLAGGDAGMRHMLEQFGPALQLSWTRLIAPQLTDELIDRVVAGCEHQAAGRDIETLERRRDNFLIELLSLVRKYWPDSEGIAGRI
jgi:carnitine 3-dehydrogenase